MKIKNVNSPEESNCFSGQSVQATHNKAESIQEGVFLEWNLFFKKQLFAWRKMQSS